MSGSDGKLRTRLFRHGDTQAIRIPPEFAFDDVNQEVEVTRNGDTLTIRPICNKTLTGIADVFGMFSPDFMAGGREFHEQESRGWEPARNRDR